MGERVCACSVKRSVDSMISVSSKVLMNKNVLGDLKNIFNSLKSFCAMSGVILFSSFVAKTKNDVSPNLVLV